MQPIRDIAKLALYSWQYPKRMDFNKVTVELLSNYFRDNSPDESKRLISRVITDKTVADRIASNIRDILIRKHIRDEMTSRTIIVLRTLVVCSEVFAQSSELCESIVIAMQRQLCCGDEHVKYDMQIMADGFQAIL